MVDAKHTVDQPCREELINGKNPSSHPSIDWSSGLETHEREETEVNWLIHGLYLDRTLIEITRNKNLFMVDLN